jgi:hypothetical protein
MPISKATGKSVAPAAKGDLVVGSATNDAAVLSVASTAGHVLTVDSSTTTGLKWAAPAAGGKVLQVVEGTTDTTTTISVVDWTDTGLTASITPSSTSSKILVLVTQQGGKTNTRSGSFRLLRGATVISVNIYQWDDGNITDFQAAAVAMAKLDSPNTTSSVTYKTQAFRSTQGSVIAQPFGTAQSNSQIILMEIGA